MERLVFSGNSTIEDVTTNRRIRSSGSSRVRGAIECQSFKSSGTLKGIAEISTEVDFNCSGTFRLDGSITSGNDIKTSGSTRISGEVTARNNFRSSGTFKVLGLLTTGGRARFSGSTTCSSGVEIKGILKTSGTFKSSNINVKQGFWGRGKVNVFNDITSQKVVDLEGGTKIGGSITAEDVFFEFRNKFRRFRYWSVVLLQFIKRVRYSYWIKGNIYAINSVDIDRSIIEGDIKSRNAKLGRFTKVNGTIYYVDKCEIHKKAKLARKPIKINLEDLKI